MGRLRRGPGGPAERRVGKLRQAALRGAQEVLEEFGFVKTVGKFGVLESRPYIIHIILIYIYIYKTG